MDIQVRAAIRRWLRLPKDVPVGYFNTPCRNGGLGIPSFTTTIPGLTFSRLTAMNLSSSSAAKAASQSDWALKRVRWAKHILSRTGEDLTSSGAREKWWAERLYNSNDGVDLRDCGKSNLSNRWIDADSEGIPGRDYVQYHHVRINTLPTRMRTTRGRRGVANDNYCRAGCRSSETAAHVIQNCHRTHGGRIKRHNAICKTLGHHLRSKGWSVQEEPHLQTADGMRKPDLVVSKDQVVRVIDVQVVSGSTSLNAAHDRKVKKYDTNEIKSIIAERQQARAEDIKVTSCTISWRGVWASKSAIALNEDLRVPMKLLAGLTTRVLQGSHTNWTRWNKMTSMIPRSRGGVG